MESDKKRFFTIKFSKNVMPVFLSVLALSLISSFIGSIYTYLYLIPQGVYQNYYYSQRRTDSQEIKEVSSGTVEYVKARMVRIFSGSDPQSPFYAGKELEAYGLFISDDGWIVSAGPALDLKGKYSVFTSENIPYQVEKHQYDNFYSLNFIKIQGSGFPVIELYKNKKSEQQAFAMFYGWNTAKEAKILDYRHVFSLDGDSGLFSSDKNKRYLLLEDEAANLKSGLPLINDYGELVGLSKVIEGEGSRIADMTALRDLVRGLFGEGGLARNYFGIHFIDLSVNPLKKLPVSQSQNQGVLVWGDELRPAVIPASPAEKAGLKKGDVILRLDKTLLDRNQCLIDLIQEYPKGATVIFTVLRNNKEMEVSVKLESI